MILTTDISHKLHAIIISWEGQEANAQFIASAITDKVASLSVIYSHSNKIIQAGAGNWIQVSNQFFFGGKFAKALEICPEGNLLLIHADAQTDDWPTLITRAHAAFATNPNLGVWAPCHTHTPWQWGDVCLGDPMSSEPQAVAQTDGIVVAFAKPVLERLKQLSYEKNHYGWGIDWAAISYAYCNNLTVLMEPALLIHHPATAQDHFSAVAFEQMQDFLTQLSAQEKVMQNLLENHISYKKTGLAIGNNALLQKHLAEQEAQRLRAHIAAIYRSHSWRWTRPLRAIRSRLSKRRI